jgi:hypothetical protein
LPYAASSFNVPQPVAVIVGRWGEEAMVTGMGRYWRGRVRQDGLVAEQCAVPLEGFNRAPPEAAKERPQRRMPWSGADLV